MNYNWKLTDLANVEKKNIKFFSTFTCGGGADMGAMNLGLDCLGGVEIDPRIMSFYQANFNHPHCFTMDIRDFVCEAYSGKVPAQLYNLDILHSSPPCSVFSMSGKREKGWGVKKKFAEGQKEQTLDDLFFVAIELVNILKPKIATFENVIGLIQGKAKNYYDEIIKRLNRIGYHPQTIIVKGETLGLPQSRHRIFIIAQREDIYKRDLQFDFNERPITFSEVRDDSCKEGTYYTGRMKEYWDNRREGDTTLAQASARVRKGKGSCFNERVIYNNKVCPTLTTNNNCTILFDEPRSINENELLAISSFPTDYNFMGASFSKKHWLCGMSIPPLMMYKVLEQVIKLL